MATTATLKTIIARIIAQLQGINATGAYNNDVSSKVFAGSHPHTEVTPPVVYVLGAFENDTEHGPNLGQYTREWVVPIIGFVAAADDESTRLQAAANLLGDITRAIEADRSLNSNVRGGQSILTGMQVYSSGPPGSGGFGVCEVDLVFAYVTDTGV